MTLVNDHVAIASNKFRQVLSARQTLDHRHIDQPRVFPSPATDLTNLLHIDAQKNRKLFAPLIQKLRSMYENQCGTFSLRDQVDANDGLAHPGRCNEDSDIRFQYRVGSSFLNGCEFSVKSNIDPLAGCPSIFYPELYVASP